MTTKKTNKTNSMTAHSKELRKKTSAKWDKGRYINRVFKVDKNKPEQMALLAKFDSIDAESQIKRLKILVDSYFNDPVNTDCVKSSSKIRHNPLIYPHVGL